MAVVPMKTLDQEIMKLSKLDKEVLYERYMLKDKYPTMENLLPQICGIPLGLSESCGMDINRYCIEWENIHTNQKTEFTGTFLYILDSSGKIGPGILRGHKSHYGLLHECTSTTYDFGDHKFVGNYISLPFLANLANSSAELCSFGNPYYLILDLCLPASCNNDDLDKIFKLLPYSCGFMDIRDLDRESVPGTYITLTVMCLCFALGITASIYDYYILPYHKHLPYTKSFPMKAWRSFSLYTNIVEIFNTKGANKPGNISPLHCMRFFSMVWVISGHAIGMFMDLSINPLDVLEITKDWGTQIIISAYLAVDTFFWQSGLLLSYIWFKKYNQNKRQTMSVFNWVMFYVHRIVRLSPPYYILIAFYTWIVSRKWVANMSPLNHAPMDTSCDSNWWIDFLYLNNFIRYDKQCYLVSWYLSTDLQMYIFAPLLLVPFTFGRLYGVITSLLVLGVSTAINVWTVIYHYFPPTDYNRVAMDKRMTVDFSFYTEVMYNAPWIRCQVYIVGLLTGYFLQHVKKLRIPLWVSVIGWIVTAGCIYGAIWSLQDWVSGNGIDIGYAALYSATSKVGWGIALTWIVVACHYGHGGFINSFMSWTIWVPLGRLTYSAYLIHIAVVLMLVGINQQGLTYTNFSQMWILLALPGIVASYLGAIIWSSSFEFAFGKLEDALIGLILGTGNKKPHPQHQPESHAQVKPQEDSAPNNEAVKEVEPPNEILAESLRKRNGQAEVVASDTGSVHTIRISKKNEERPALE